MVPEVVYGAAYLSGLLLVALGVLGAGRWLVNTAERVLNRGRDRRGDDCDD